MRALLLLSLLLHSAASAQWTISTFAGTGVAGGSGDGGPAKAAQIDNPFGVVRGPDGAIWFCEYTGQRIRRVDEDGTIRTIAGTGKKGYTGDGGLARAAELNQPHSIQFGPDGDLYICDIGNHVIRKVSMQDGTIRTIAGTGKPGPTPDGAPITGTPLKGPRSLDFDKAGNLWLATREGNQVFKLDLKGNKIHHIAGTGKKGFTGNGGPAKEATLSGPKGISIDAAGNVWLADCESHSIRMIDARTGRLELIAGSNERGDGPDGNPLSCKMARPHGIFCDAGGSVFIGDSESHRVRVLKRP